MTKVLVVDDSLTVRKIIRRELEPQGFEIEEAANGIEALEIIPLFVPDIITLDVEMPKMDGFECCRRIRFGHDGVFAAGEENSKIPVIFFTANANLQMRTRGFEVGADEYLTKPPIKGEMLAAVNRVLYKADNLKGLSALVVDDSAMIRKLLVRVLANEGLKVHDAPGGQEALDFLKSNEVDLVLTDFVMPEMDGVELCKKIRHELGLVDLPVIFLTSASDKESLVDIFKAGATDYLVKPLVSEELFARLRVHLKEKQLKYELYEKVQALNEAHKLKDEFLSIASHDLRSPLNGILGFVQLLEMEEGLPDDVQEYVGYIKTSGVFLLDLINDLLDLGRLTAEKDELKLEATDVVSVIEGSLITLNHMATPKSIKLSFQNMTAGPVSIISDTNALTRVINNFLSNAVKFTPNNGQVKAILSEVDGKIHVDIQDTGIGISEANIPKLFDKFTSASQTGTAGEKSTGLGLSITKTLIEKMDATVNVTSKVGLGTTFTIIFDKA
ncbi:MAG: response regulator [SAR324 cluster bacterium]|nr:response regulator [SAR324 cluster bacterium]